ncbi:hypothetical protein K439DRAFT_1364231 [Ramaria rubella]|nr:hypothetical protein K439DRAFT_1364231 [Ramaria rubella]
MIDSQTKLKVSIAMFLYDYYLTLPDEVRLIWRRPFRLSTILYFMLRFLPLPQIIFHFCTTMGIPRCQQFYRITTSFANLARGTVLVLRTYAVYDRNVKVLIGLGSLGLAAVAFNYVSA